MPPHFNVMQVLNMNGRAVSEGGGLYCSLQCRDEHGGTVRLPQIIVRRRVGFVECQRTFNEVRRRRHISQMTNIRLIGGLNSAIYIEVQATYDVHLRCRRCNASFFFFYTVTLFPSSLFRYLLGIIINMPRAEIARVLAICHIHKYAASLASPLPH